MKHSLSKIFLTALTGVMVLNTPIENHVISSSYAATNPSQGFADLVERLSPAVVNISTTSIVGSSPMDQFFGQGLPPEFNDLFNNFFGRSPFGMNGGRHSQKREVKSLGSGFVIDADGYVVTNHHVVDNADEIEINFPDGSNYKAEVVGSDKKTDLALVKIIDGDKKFPFVNWGDSKTARVGEWVVAIGNPYGLSGSVSAGIISALNRNINAGPYDNFIQTDAAINRGNSGGPLFNMDGKVIGVNSAIISPSGGSVGVGFSIPENLARNVITQIKEKGSVERGRLGIYFQPLTNDIADALGLPYDKKPQGVLIGSVEPNGPADRAGLKSGDIIVKIGNQEIIEDNELPRIVANLPVNKFATVNFYRNGKLKTVRVKIVKDAVSEITASETPNGGIFIKDMGIEVADLTPQSRGQYRISDRIQGVIIENTQKSKIREFRTGDIILELNQQPLSSSDKFVKIFAKAKSAKEPVLFKIYRNGNIFYFAVRFK